MLAMVEAKEVDSFPSLAKLRSRHTKRHYLISTLDIDEMRVHLYRDKASEATLSRLGNPQSFSIPDSNSHFEKRHVSKILHIRYIRQ